MEAGTDKTKNAFNKREERTSRKTALHLAAEQGDVPGIEKLLKDECLKFKINAQDQDGNTALHCAIKRRAFECVKMLALTSDLTLKDQSGRTVLHSAAERGDEKSVRVLLSMGTALINMKDHLGKTALHYAAKNGHAACVKSMLPAYKVLLPDNQGKTALHYAAKKGSAPCVALLLPLTNGNVKDHSGRTALHWALFKRELECIKLLQPSPRLKKMRTARYEGRPMREFSELTKTRLNQDKPDGVNKIFQKRSKHI